MDTIIFYYNLNLFFKNIINIEILYNPGSLYNPMEQFQILIIKQCSENILYSLNNFFFFLFAISLYLYLIFYFFITYQNFFLKNRIQYMFEQIIFFIYGIIKENINIRYYLYNFKPFLTFIFLIIVFANLISLIPYMFALTSHLIFTFTLALFAIFCVNKIAIERYGISFLQYFLPPGSPLIIAPFLVIIEFISYSARVFSLSIRLFANIMSGHILLKILASFTFLLGILSIFLIIILSAIFFLEFAIAILQGYVFLTLITIYFKEAIFLH
jgi:F-type H+-transporting ATPase subunit a